MGPCAQNDNASHRISIQGAHNHGLWLMVWTAPYGISCARMRLLRSQTREPSVDQIIRIGMDTSKHFFQLHGVDATERPVLRRQLRRNEVLAFFAKQSPTVIGMEACGAGHYWARELRKLGHEVKLIAPQHVKAYVKRNKNDGRDHPQGSRQGRAALGADCARREPACAGARDVYIAGPRLRAVAGRTEGSRDPADGLASRQC